MAGKWKSTLQIKDLLTEETTSEAIIRAANGIYDRLPPQARSIKEDFRKAVSYAEKDAEVGLMVFNDAMEKLYDWADDTGVWVA